MRPAAAASRGDGADVSGLRADGPVLRLLLAGEPTELVRTAARHRLLDVEIARPSLEEAFVAAYGHPDPAEPA